MQRGSPIPSSVTGAVFTILGVVAVIGGVLAYRWQRRFLRKAQSASGVVQSIRAERLERSTVYYPVIQFTTAAGVSVTAESHTSQSGLQVGQKIPILYDPANPQNLEINAFWSRWSLIFIAAFAAAILFAIGLSALLAPLVR